LQVNGLPVKASRIFLGKEHEYSVTKIAEHFKINIDFYKTINKPHTFNINNYSPQFINLKSSIDSITAWDLSLFNTPQQAYTCLMQNLTQLLIESVNLILTDDIKTIYVDGGFANNKLFKYYLSAHFNTIQIITANFKQATAYGAFLHLKNAINKS
jgi:sugar (pentulose or hexulose) kinase